MIVDVVMGLVFLITQPANQLNVQATAGVRHHRHFVLRGVIHANFAIVVVMGHLFGQVLLGPLLHTLGLR